MTNARDEPKGLEELKQAVHNYADRHANSEGMATTPIAGLRMMRAYEPTGPIRSIYRPLVCLILQGAKQMAVAREEQVFTAGQSAIIGVDVPVLGRIVRASRDEPYLAVALELDATVMQSVASQVPDSRRAISRARAPLFTTSLEDDILNCATRMMRLIDYPEAEPVVRPAVMQEMHYWLLSSAHGPALRALTLPDGYAQRIAASIEIVRKNFHQPLRVEELAATANMSSSAFHRRFKALTSLSPVQFQKQLRLIEARRLIRSEGLTASNAGFQVGYESASQFTREYARMFGAPPRRDTSGRTLEKQGSSVHGH